MPRLATILALVAGAGALHKRSAPHINVEQQFKICSTSNDCAFGYKCAPPSPGDNFSICQWSATSSLRSINASDIVDAPTSPWIVLDGVSFKGKTIKTVPNVTLVEQCASLCVAEPKCQSVDFDTSAWPEGICHLKGIPLDMMASSSSIAAASYPNNYSCVNSADYYGSDTFNATGNFQDCFRTCSSNTVQCNGFTWTQGVLPISSDGHCFFKNLSSSSPATPSNKTSLLALTAGIAALHKRSAQHIGAPIEYKTCTSSDDCSIGYSCVPPKAGYSYSSCQKTHPGMKMAAPEALAPKAYRWLVLDGVSFLGASIGVKEKVVLVDQCKTACDSDKSCGSVAYDMTAWPAGTCHLSSGPLQMALNSTMISAVMHPETYACARGSPADASADGKKGDFPECFSQCDDLGDKCSGFAWSPAGTSGSTGTCFFATTGPTLVQATTKDKVLACKKTGV
ncbi:hypothetical protein ACHHYP_14245 [Achlya hypogyna]|uniref:Apple domain-containing protein n=1 Tax=Achlya hypogyna TaxID=1202772 RepID=A0A1V9YDS4_ACHHY|nr:hypothetical protein ACHHYP_14245 [Achlya hypogyna]